MEKVEGINLNQLVEEARVSLKSERMREAKKSIRYVIQGIETTEKKITEMEKEIEKKEKSIERGQKKIKSIREGAWHLLSDEKSEK